jgi:hypothetical protein
MIDGLWDLACAVAEIAEPLVEAFGVSVYKLITGDKSKRHEVSDEEIAPTRSQLPPTFTRIRSVANATGPR